MCNPGIVLVPPHASAGTSLISIALSVHAEISFVHAEMLVTDVTMIAPTKLFSLLLVSLIEDFKQQRSFFNRISWG